jgi:hypothetical protein
MASASTATARFAGLPRDDSGLVATAPVSPKGRTPTSLGSSRIKIPMTGTTSAVTAATIHGAARHPWVVTAFASEGRKTS